MANLYLLNPTSKLRSLSALVLKASRRILKKNISLQPPRIPDLNAERSHAARFNLKVFDLVDTDLRHVHHPQGRLFRDMEYYKDEREAGLCVFRVENTLFKVHKCYLLREPCVFGDMFSLPFVKGSNEGLPEEPAIPLSDTAEQFRDLLWALYAVPAQLYASIEEDDAVSLDRLLNIAQLANKYCIASYESWALERVFSLAQNPNGFLRHAPPETCARALDVAFLCNHDPLVDVIIQRLTARILWSNVNRQPILQVATRLGLTTLQGVIFYRELVDLERTTRDESKTSGLAFLSAISDEETRIRLFTAYHSLVNLWDRIRTTPPPPIVANNDHTCRTHSECLATWTNLWLAVASSDQTLKYASVDVLGRLKSMMIQLKKMTMEDGNGLSLRCTLAALESIASARDDIVAGLIRHFQHRYADR